MCYTDEELNKTVTIKVEGSNTVVPSPPKLIKVIYRSQMPINYKQEEITLKNSK